MADWHDFEEMARTLHASYLSRWSKHDPIGLVRAAQPEGERQATAEPRRKENEKEKVSAA